MGKESMKGNVFVIEIMMALLLCQVCWSGLQTAQF